MGLVPTSKTIIGNFINGRNAADDFLQLATNHGGTVFGWIDASGLLQGTLANISVASISGVLKAGTGITFIPTGTTLTISSTSTSNPGGANTDIQFNNAGVFGGDSEFTWNTATKQLFVGPPTSSLSTNMQQFPFDPPATEINRWLKSTDPYPANSSVIGLQTITQSDQNTFIWGSFDAVDATNLTSAAAHGDEVDLYFNIPLTFSAGAIGRETFVIPYGAGNTSQAYAYEGAIQNIGTGTVGNAVQFNASGNLNSGGGSITTVSGFRFEDNSGIAGTTHGFIVDTQSAPTNMFGFYCSSLGASNYGFYSVSASNYFGGTATTAAVQITNPTAATSLLNQTSPLLELSGAFWTGSASAVSTWSIQTTFGTSQKSFLEISQSGSPAPAVMIDTELILGKMGGTSGTLAFNGTSSGLFAFAVASNAGSINAVQLPTLSPTTTNSLWMVTSGNPNVSSFFNVGTAGQVLSTDATGQLLTWISPGSSAVTSTIASGTATLGTTLITSGSKASLVTVSAPGTLATDTIMADFNTDPSSTTGYAPSVNGMLTIIKYPTANNVNFWVYNNTGASITPGAVTLNWRVVR